MFKDYSKVLNKRAKKLDAVTEDAAAQAAQYAYLKAIEYAPESTGLLKSSGKRLRIFKGLWHVMFGYPGPDGFPIARWTNMEFVIVPKIQGGKASRYLKTPVGQPVRYGDSNGVRWTAKQYPWWDIMVMELRQRFKTLYINNIKFAWRR